MKRLGLLVAASAMLLVNATAAQAQAILNTSGSSMAVATPLNGTVLIEDSGARVLPAGYNETGRLARFSGDTRLMQDDIKFSNRDFQDWKPMEATSKTKISHRIDGRASRYHHPIADFSTSRFARDISQNPDGRLVANEMIFSNRDFEDLKPLNAPDSNHKMNSRLRGLASGTNLMEGRRVAVRVGPAVERSELWY